MLLGDSEMQPPSFQHAKLLIFESQERTLKNYVTYISIGSLFYRGLTLSVEFKTTFIKFLINFNLYYLNNTHIYLCHLKEKKN